MPPKKVNIVVLGDVGRSPRMQYHALSFANENFNVELIGFSGSEIITGLKQHSNVKVRYMKNCPDLRKYLPNMVIYALKVLWQTIVLFFSLIMAQSCDYLLVQNPPAIPSLTVCYIYSCLFRCKLIIDWHNYAYSIMALTHGSEHKLVKLSKLIEFYFGRRSQYNLCVTKAMKEDLQINHNIKSIVLYDRPPDAFHIVDIQEKHDLFLNLGKEYKIFIDSCKENETIFTKTCENGIVLKDNRPGLIVSSTSWTEDEDFSILLSALEDYEKSSAIQDLPKLICCITGKGPLKEFYKSLISRREWKCVNIITPWLTPTDYPLLIGSADVGVSLHNSSSGFDLPMKVVDMFGCGVPVFAHKFNCVSELVQHDINGLVFETSQELAQELIQWFEGFPKHCHEKHGFFRKELEKFGELRWHENWKLNVLTMLD